MTQSVGIKKPPRVPIAAVEAMKFFDSTAGITKIIEMQAPQAIILRDRLNQWNFSMSTGKIIELRRPTKTNVADITLI